MARIDTAEFKRRIMLFLLWDDHMGLWDPKSELAGLYPDMPLPERQEITAQTLLELHAAGLIALYRFSDGANEPAFTQEEAEAEINAAWWREDDPHPGDVWIRATPAAEVAEPS